MIRGRARLWGSAVVAIALGAALRLWFIQRTTLIAGDTLLYGDIARNWMQHGIYGFSQAEGDPLPTLIRLPGYPLFLMLCFRLFGIANYRAVVLLQCVVDLLACLLLADLVRRLFGSRSALLALFLAALCPFTASYVASPLTETLTCASIVLAFYALARWSPPAAVNSLNSHAPLLEPPRWNRWNRWLWILSAALAGSILLRPDQGLLAVAVLPAMLWLGNLAATANAPDLLPGAARLPAPKARRLTVESSSIGPRSRLSIQPMLPMLAAALCALLPLAPWTIRNAHTFHAFQPLAPRSATDPGEPVPTGFYRWYRTWAIDYASTEDIYWNYDGAAIHIEDLPLRAFDSPAQFAETAELLRDYNLTTRPSPDLDERFNTIALARIHAGPLRYYLALPAARLLNMLLRPRVEMLPIPLAWWRLHEHPGQTAFALAYGTLSLAYLALGALGLSRCTRRRSGPAAPIAWSMLAFVALRCALLLTLDNSEPRYTLEFFPIFIVGTAALFAERGLRTVPALPPESS